MILPNKTIRLENSLLGVGAIVLSACTAPQTVSSLWERLKNKNEINTFGKFVLTLDFLYTIGLLDLDNELIEIKKV
jgi:hypothetical protein